MAAGCGSETVVTMVAIGFARAEAAGSDCARTVGAAIEEKDTESEDDGRLGRAIETERK